MRAPVPEGLLAVDERFHDVGDGQWWGESWYFDFASRDGSVGGYVRIGFYPNQQACWYWACLVGEGRRPVMVVDHDVPVPRSPHASRCVTTACGPTTRSRPPSTT